MHLLVLLSEQLLVVIDVRCCQKLLDFVLHRHHHLSLQEDVLLQQEFQLWFVESGLQPVIELLSLLLCDFDQSLEFFVGALVVENANNRGFVAETFSDFTEIVPIETIDQWDLLHVALFNDHFQVLIKPILYIFNFL